MNKRQSFQTLSDWKSIFSNSIDTISNSFDASKIQTCDIDRNSNFLSSPLYPTIKDRHKVISGIIYDHFWLDDLRRLKLMQFLFWFRRITHRYLYYWSLFKTMNSCPRHSVSVLNNHTQIDALKQYIYNIFRVLSLSNAFRPTQ